jgi:phosphatidylinositol-3-phosphatase
MNTRILSILIFTFLLLPGFLFAQLPQPDHTVIIIEENHGYDQIIGSNAAPYINSLANDTLSALFTDSHGVTHPSQPNYLWLFSGDNQGVTTDNLPTDTPFTTLNIGALLLSNNKTFTGYSEDLPYTGFNGASSGAYARKHNPWVNWQDADPNGIPSGLNKPFTDFPSDYSTLPTVSFVVPNQNNDMHNGSDPSRITTGDTWLQNNLDGYIQWAKTHNSLAIVTFDEDDFTGSNHIATLFVGELVLNGEYNQTINHLNILRTIEDMYGLGYAGSSGDSTSITNCWKEVTPVELTSFNAYCSGTSILLDWETATETNNKGFEIQRRNSNSNTDWERIGFVDGNGTTTEQHSYSYADNSTDAGKYFYRLRQIDFDGRSRLSNEIEIDISNFTYSLAQNYPNPFNPSTTIKYSIPSASRVVIKIFNILGKEVSTLVNENKEAGNYTINFNASELPSGIYLYRIDAGAFSQVRKMILLK